MFGGNIVRGDGMGAEYGFPTANIDCVRDDVDYQEGVYAAWAYIRKKKYASALVVQENPWKVEVHILNYSGDLYGTHIQIDPVQKVAELEYYEFTDELIEKIKKDIEMVKHILQG